MIELCSLKQYDENFQKAQKIFCFLKKDKGFQRAVIKEEKPSSYEKDLDTLVVYGIGFGFFYLQAKKWLDGPLTSKAEPQGSFAEKKRRLIFLEDDEKALHDFLQTSIAENVLDDPRVRIYFLGKDSADDLTFKKIAWENLFLKIKILPSFFYSISKKRHFLEIEGKLNEMIFGAALSVSQYKDFGSLHFQNSFKNLLSLKKIKLLSSLRNSFQGLPAIICGAGPSLEESLPTIQKMKDKALIFAAGSALNVLSQNGLKPHFAGGIDKEASTERFLKNDVLETAFFYQMQISKDNLALVDGEKILVSSDGNLSLENFLFQSLSISQDKLDCGWTAGTFLIAVAHFLGCCPIIFTGLDFSFSKKRYAGLIKADKREKNYDFIETLDVFQKKVYTQKDWLLAVKWIEDFAKNNKISLVNANNGGLEIKGVLKASVQDYLSLKTLDLFSLVHSRVHSAEELDLPLNEVLIKLKEIEKSASKCQKIIEEEFSALEKDFEKNNFREDYFSNNLEKELFYENHLLVLWNYYSSLIKRNLEEKSDIPKNFLIYVNKLIFLKTAIEEYSKLCPIWQSTN